MTLRCEWNECHSTWDGIESFSRHFTDHVNQLEDTDVLANADSGRFVCLWSDCRWESENRSKMCLHASFHPYHSYLKHVGRTTAAERKLGNCTLGEATVNDIPDVHEVYACGWRDCKRTFYCPYQYYCHVENHAVSEDPEEGTTLFKCEWQGLKLQFELRV